MPLTYTSADPVAYFSILLFWTNFGGNPAGYALVDDIHFDVSTNVVEPSGNLSGIKLSEITPGYYKLSSSTNSLDNFSVQVYDLNGREIIEPKALAENNQNYSTVINLSEVSSGIYFCKVYSKSEYRTFKLIKY